MAASVISLKTTMLSRSQASMLFINPEDESCCADDIRYSLSPSLMLPEHHNHRQTHTQRKQSEQERQKRVFWSRTLARQFLLVFQTCFPLSLLLLRQLYFSSPFTLCSFISFQHPLSLSVPLRMFLPKSNLHLQMIGWVSVKNWTPARLWLCWKRYSNTQRQRTGGS